MTFDILKHPDLRLHSAFVKRWLARKGWQACENAGEWYVLTQDGEVMPLFADRIADQAFAELR